MKEEPAQKEEDKESTPTINSPTKANTSVLKVSSIHELNDLRIHCLNKAENNKNTNSNDKLTTILVGLVYIYASWVVGGKSSDSNSNNNNIQSVLYRIRDSLLLNDGDDNNNDDVHWMIGSLQVDESDESLNHYVGDDIDKNNNDAKNKKNDQKKNDLRSSSCPPEDLPMIAVIVQSPTMERSELCYITDKESSKLLRFYHYYSGNRNHTSIIPTELIPACSLSVTTFMNKVLGNNNNNNSNNNNSEHPPAAADTTTTTSSAIRIFVAGDRSSVGKSSVCLGILGTLVEKMGYEPSSLAYIKPATQCEAPQLVQKYCDTVGIDCVPVGPIVYYAGFTRSFLAGQTEPSDELLRKAGQAVDQIAANKRLVLIDGVGFPSVGSICGTDNASVAKACGYPIVLSPNDNQNKRKRKRKRKPLGVLLIGGSGVGAAVDAFNLNATYFEAARIPVLGAVFNKLSTDEGFYSLENCKTQVTRFFQQNKHQQKHNRKAFGFLPQVSDLATTNDNGSNDYLINVVLPKYFSIFETHVNVTSILEAATKLQQQPIKDYDDGGGDDNDSLQQQTIIPSETREESQQQQQQQRPIIIKTKSVLHDDDPPIRQPVQVLLTREQIEKQASTAGAATTA